MAVHGVPPVIERPTIGPDAWVAPGAILIGNVRLGRGASVWYGCVLRSDMTGAEIVVGEDTNLQDGTVVHIDEDAPCRIGARVTVGHRAVIHAATVEDDCLIGMGAVVLTGAKIGRGSVVAAGALVPEGMDVPPGVLVAGVPAKIKRPLTDEDRAKMDHGWRVYTGLRDLHKTTRRKGT